MMRSGRPRMRRTGWLPVILASVVLSACSGADSPRSDDDEADEQTEQAAAPTDESAITLAFGGDVHFEGALAPLPDQRRSTLGDMSSVLREADLAMVNLESALTARGAPTSKELEDPTQRFWFRSRPGALELMERSGVDAVSIANNHGADYGAEGLRGTLRTARDSPVAVVGVGADGEAAFTPYRQTIRGTDVAVLAADAAMRESADPIWAAGEGGPGIAAARSTPPARLLTAVRAAAEVDDLVVVYMHWGEELAPCPTGAQQRLAQAISRAGADVIVGAHAHVPMGSGMLGDTYVAYGLGNFAWYHGRQADSGVMRLRVADGEVLDEDWLPARIPELGGTPEPRTARDRQAAGQRQARLRGCAGLAPAPGSVGGPPSRYRQPPPPEPSPEPSQEPSRQPSEQPSREPALPAYAAEVREIGPFIRQRMSASHDAARCPVALADLRYLQVRHIDFDGQSQTGEIVVAADVADDVVEVFRRLYRSRWPIARMELVDNYGADDDASMAANNSSGYNCRTVAGSDSFSDHARGLAIDINPVQNPYVLPDGVLPPAGAEFADVDRSADSPYQLGVIREGDAVNRAFAGIGWEWGDGFADYQHFFVP